MSSSQESSRSIANLQKALMEAKKREETHKRLILQIQNQKKQLELEHQSLLQAANSLQNTNTDTAVSCLYNLFACVCVHLTANQIKTQ